MSWLRNHPYAATSAIIGLLIIAGAIFIESRRSIGPGELTVWGGTGAPLLNPTSYVPGSGVPRDQGATAQATTPIDTAPAYIPPAPNTESETGGEDMDFESFLLSLIAPQQQNSSSSSTSADIDLAYSFIPQGLIAVHTPQNTRTPEQQRLFDYGNDAGSYIETYEDSNRNAAVALRDQAEDRQNPQKIQAVKLVAAGLRTVGESLLGMENVPPAIQSEHTALAESYIETGKRLATVPDAINSDDAFIQRIESYNAAADIWVKNYIAISTIFSIHGVKFSDSDPGSIFVFSRGSGL